jgi:single-stranded DNA-binding protein
MLAVPRRYSRTDYLPVIVWGRLALEAAGLPVSAPVTLEGRIQSREYTKVTDDGPCQRTAYEVSVMQFLEEDE